MDGHEVWIITWGKRYVINENHNSLGCEQPSGLDVNSHPMHMTCFGQYQASSAVLG